jgi:L-seryl-tRNA(Ser) seleniumtransferase
MASPDPSSRSRDASDVANAERGDHDPQSRFRRIPPVDSIVEQARRHGSRFTDEALTRLARAELDRARQALLNGEDFSRVAIEQSALAAILGLETPRLAPVINATGVIIHTNLGRAPVSGETAEAMRLAAASPVALEIEPDSNERGGRMREISGLMRALTGAEAALVVNNCASAVLLALAATAAGKGVVVSRGEAVEIGGGFRVPDVLRQSGARLVEVGTTNRTYARDYAAATDGETGAYLKVHPSNFRSFGFVHAASTVELAALAREHGVAILEDLGSGAMLDTARFGLAHEPTIVEAIDDGADLVMASGDKLLGGPQAGIIVGRAPWVERVARHPLARAVRADKTALAGIAATLRHYARGEAEASVPIWRMIGAAEADIRERADRAWVALRRLGIEADREPIVSTVGGGSLPGETLPSWGIVLGAVDDEGIDALARRLRLGDPGVFGRIERERLLLDLRTVLPEDDEMLVGAVSRAVAGSTTSASPKAGP